MSNKASMTGPRRSVVAGAKARPAALDSLACVTASGSVINWFLDSDPSIRWQVMRDLWAMRVLSWWEGSGSSLGSG
jgi:hypothetical protein